MKVLVECLQGTKEKMEVTPDRKGFYCNRMLKRKWIANYGLIPNTLQEDGDELDAYIIGNNLKQGEVIDALPICMIYVIDNYKIDNKIVCAAATARNIKYTVRKIFNFIGKYKKNCLPVAITWKERDITYEYAKCKAYRNLFKGGK